MYRPLVVRVRKTAAMTIPAIQITVCTGIPATVPAPRARKLSGNPRMPVPPDSPVAIPRYTASVARVTTIAGTRTRAMTQPFSHPASVPVTTPIATAGQMGRPRCHSSPIAIADRAMLDATDRSMPRLMMIIVIGSATRPISAAGFVAALAGMIYAARVGTAKSNAAAGYELSIITAVVLGGTSLAGGEGTLVGTVLGVLILTILQNGLTLARVPAAMQDVLIGTVLLAAVLTYRERPMRKEVSAQSTSQPAPRRAAGRAMSDPENTLAAGEERRKP